MTRKIVKPNINQAKLLYSVFFFALGVLLTGVLLRSLQTKTYNGSPRMPEHNGSMINATATSGKTRKEYLYRLLTNTNRSLIQMEIKARRLEENMRRIKEKTADLLWKQDKALWHILFKNISRRVSLRHEFHQHSSLKRIMQDSQGDHKYQKSRRKMSLANERLLKDIWKRN